VEDKKFSNCSSLTMEIEGEGGGGEGKENKLKQK
jgi:hypothetical protein